MNQAKALTLSSRQLITVLYYALPLVFLALALYFIPVLYHLVLMFLFSYLISHLFVPPINFLVCQNFSRNSATLTVFLFILLIATALVWAYAPATWNQVVELQEQLADGDLMELSRNYAARTENLIPFLPQGSLTARIDELYSWLFGQMTGMLANVYIVIQYLIIVPFIAFFLVRDRERLRRSAVQKIPNAFFEMFFNIYYKIDQQVGEYMRGLIIEALIVAVLSIIGLVALGVPYAIVIGLFAGLANIVPYFGPIAGAIPAVAIKFLETGEIYPTALVALVFLIIQVLDNLWLKPFVFSRGMKMHPLLVFLVVVGGGQLAGIPGMILGIPLAASFLVIFREFYWGVRNYSFVETLH